MENVYGGILLLSMRQHWWCDYRFSTFLLWLQSVQIPPHLFSGAKVVIFPNSQIAATNYFLISL